jgi:hypothetical protein
MIYGQVVCNSTDPWKELAFFIVPPAPYGVYRFDKRFLKQIFCHIPVANDQVNGCIQLRFMAVEKRFKSPFVTMLIA